MVARWASSLVNEAMEDTRVVFVMGARQVGKSTLVADHAREHGISAVVTLDDKVVRDAARSDPTGFVAGLPRPCVIDEVQRAPDVLLAIKETVDRDPRPGSYLLTGSSNVRTNRRVKDALTGRMETITLWPLAQGEIHHGRNVVDAFLEGTPPVVTDAIIGVDAYAGALAGGGFPEALTRSGRRRDRWYQNYIDTTLDRDLRDLSDAAKLDAVPHLLRLLAAQSAGLVNYATLAGHLGVSATTVTAYIELLETVFMIRRLPAWRPGLVAREVHAPKVHIVDTGLLMHLLGADETRIGRDDQVTGKALETFVAMEIIKQIESARTDVRPYHYRAGRDEVDLVLETRAGDIVGVEVKASATPSAADRRCLEKLRDAAGSRFKAGVIVYTGRQTVPQGDRLWAMPVSGLWA